jgi:DNA (cytosine-5)-methyltransferase 1
MDKKDFCIMTHPTPSISVRNHQSRKVSPIVLSRIQALGIGQKMQDLPEELWHESFRYYVKEDPNRKGGPNLRLIRLDPDQPSLTVTGFIYNKFIHPFEDRFITPREAARLQGFPDTFEFIGTQTSVQRQIGDAVPIELGEALFKAILSTAKSLSTTQNSLPALSLFSGCGGLDIALNNLYNPQEISWQTVACVESEKDRCDTLRGYFDKDLKVFERDITTLQPEEVLANCHLKRQDIWLIYGGPPCQSFSQAGKQKGKSDPRGDLIFEFLRFAKEIQPKFFLLENVSNLKAIDAGKLLKDILHEIDSIGYNIQHDVLNSAQYGNAQKRHRLIMIGTRKDLNVVACLPQPTHSNKPDLFGTPAFKTVRQAFRGLPMANP